RPERERRLYPRGHPVQRGGPAGGEHDLGLAHQLVHGARHLPARFQHVHHAARDDHHHHHPAAAHLHHAAFDDDHHRHDQHDHADVATADDDHADAAADHVADVAADHVAPAALTTVRVELPLREPSVKEWATAG